MSPNTLVARDDQLLSRSQCPAAGSLRASSMLEIAGDRKIELVSCCDAVLIYRRQMTLPMLHDAGFERQYKVAHRDSFLTEIGQVVPWSELCAIVAPHHPKDPELCRRQPSHGRLGADPAHSLPDARQAEINTQ